MPLSIVFGTPTTPTEFICNESSATSRRHTTRPEANLDRAATEIASRLHLTIKFVDGRRHLPVVELTQAA
jgi:hypothetical protein